MVFLQYLLLDVFAVLGYYKRRINISQYHEAASVKNRERIMSFVKINRIIVSMGLVLMWVFLRDMTVSAEEAVYQDTVIMAEGVHNPQRLQDENRDTYSTAGKSGVVTVLRSDGIGAVYVEFDRIPQLWTLTDPVSQVSVTYGKNGFLHEFVDVASLFEEPPKSLIMTFEDGTQIAEIYGFSEGDVPSWVQIWQPPCESADLLLISSHSDDEQLFFSGVLPYYAGEMGLRVQVAYVVQHFEANGVANHKRPHEQLDGLWTVGVRNYPVMSDFPDLYAESKDRKVAFEQALAVYESAGITYNDFLSYITECFRRFKPLVVVSHDLAGEYGHGTHVVCASAITEAIEYAADESRYPESFGEYGTWSVKKVYLHLYEENRIVMNYDKPLEYFGGKTAFQVSQDGFACHKSQHWTWFYKWIYGTEEKPITKATDIVKYSPCLYGLYYSSVGLDIKGGDFFENIVTYEEREAEIARLEKEAKEKEEAERLAAEAKTKEEAERLAAEAKAREEAERLAAELREKEERQRAEEVQRKNAIMMGSIIGMFILVIIVGLGIFIYHGRDIKKKEDL